VLLSLVVAFAGPGSLFLLLKHQPQFYVEPEGSEGMFFPGLSSVKI
jgi:hypothetical protein